MVFPTGAIREMLDLKEFGCQRSGTNFLRVILQENYDVRLLTNVGGWKHGYYEVPRRLHREVDCVICVKDPYAWLVSQYNYRYPNKETSFAEFIEQPLTIVAKRGSALGQVDAASPIALWVRMYEHWLDFDLLHRRKFVLRYESMLDDPVSTIQPLVDELQLRRRVRWEFRIRRALGLVHGDPALFLPTVRLMAVPNAYGAKDIKQGSQFDKSRYTQRKYLASYTRELLATVNRHLSSELLAKLGYRRLTEAELPTGS